MDKDNRTRIPADDEFDVELLFAKLWQVQKKMWKKLFYPIEVCLWNKKKLIVALLIAIIAAVIVRYTFPPTYKTNFILKPFNPTDWVGVGMLTDLELMVKDENYADLSEVLQLDIATCEQLEKVVAIPIFKNQFRKDTLTGLLVELYIGNARLVNKFQDAILTNYLEKNPHYVKRNTLYKQELALMEIRLNHDIKENDSLKKVIIASTFPRNAGGLVYGEPIDPIKIYQNGFELNKKLISLNTAKEYVQSFELAKPGVVRLKPYFPRLVILLPVFIFLALLYCLVSNIRKE